MNLDELPYANDPLPTLQSKLKDTVKAWHESKYREENLRVRMGWILIQAAHRFFDLPLLPNRAHSYDQKEGWKEFKDWTDKYSGLKWTTCKEYMKYAWRPDMIEKHAAHRRASKQRQQQDAAELRAMHGGVTDPELRKQNMAVHSLGNLPIGPMFRSLELALIAQVESLDLEEVQGLMDAVMANLRNIQNIKHAAA